MLDLLGYPPTQQDLPNLSKNVNQAALETAVNISHRSPLDQVQRFYGFLNSQRTISAKANLAKDWSLDKIKRLVKA